MIIKQLPILIFVFIIFTTSSCRTGDLQLTYPNSYLPDGFEIESVKAFKYDGSTFNEISISQAADPDVGVYNSFLTRLEITSETEVTVSDNFETQNVMYQLEKNVLDFRANGSRFKMDFTADGSLLELLIGSGGPYDVVNTSDTRASCSDINCFQDHHELLYGSTVGEIQYLIVFKERYTQH